MRKQLKANKQNAIMAIREIFKGATVPHDIDRIGFKIREKYSLNYADEELYNYLMELVVADEIKSLGYKYEMGEGLEFFELSTGKTTPDRHTKPSQ